MVFEGKNVVVAGLARSGVAACKVLSALGANVRACDGKPIDKLTDEVRNLASLPNVELLAGSPVEDHLFTDGIIVISPGIPLDSPLAVKGRELGNVIMSELELGYLTAKAPLMAVTGTNGKTTTTSLLTVMMANTGRKAEAVGNIGLPITAASLEMPEEGVLVTEVSSYQLETIFEFRPRIAGILNLKPDHLNRHKTAENYYAAKARIFENMKNDDVLVLNQDDENCMKLVEQANCEVSFFSSTATVPRGCFVKNGYIYYTKDAEEIQICRIGEVRIPGRHNLENALAASTMALEMGADVMEVRRALASFEGIEHRLEKVLNVQGVWFINDSKATNPDAAVKGIEAMDRPTILIAGGSQKNTGFAEVAEVLKDSYICHAILIGETADEIDEAFRKEGFTAIEHAEDFRSAVRHAFACAKPGYNVLLCPACASFDMFTDYEQRGRIFKELAKEIADKVENDEKTRL